MPVRSSKKKPRACRMDLLEAKQLLAADVVISEFLASNSNGIRDEDGNRSDWIELLNAGDADQNLNNWYLTDDPDNLDGWKFPDIVLPAGESLLVFASNKDRDSSDGELHTDFKLSTNAGSYLALVRPDLTIAHEYSPSYPPQVTDISYGLPTVSTVTTLLATGASGKFLVPLSADATRDENWFKNTYSDSTWTSVTMGVGYETDPTDPPPGTVIANSQTEFSNIQGQNGWSYGYWVKSGDANGVYAPTEMVNFLWNGTSIVGNFNHWDGTKWDFRSGATRPLTELSATGGKPAAFTGFPPITHNTIRRYTSEVAGTLKLTGTLADIDPTGDGAIGRILVDGVQIYEQAINNNSFNYSVVTTVPLGAKIDFMIDAGPSTEDTGDATTFTTIVEHLSQLPPANLAAEIATNVQAAMQNKNASAYLRIPFTVADVASIDVLRLNLKYDAGYVVYLNGLEVARNNTPSTPTWNSAATTERPDADAIQFESINLSDYLGIVANGPNLLAIQGLNSVADDSDFLLSAELQGRSLSLDRNTPKYFFTPTPDAVNGTGTTTLGPIVAGINHSPNVPTDNQDLVVTATVTPSFDPIANVTLNYRVMYGAIVQLPMLDDGLHGDGAAGDHVYGASIPASASTPGQMIRYFITSTDSTNDQTRWPQFGDPIDSEEYYGTVVANPTVDSDLPVFELFLQNPTAADSGTGTRASLFYNGEFYDNIKIDVHGQSTSGFPKKSYDIDFNGDHRFLWKEGMERMKDINLLSNWADKTKERNTMAYEVYANAGSPHHLAQSIRIQQNGTFFSVADFVEDGDDVYLERNGLDPDGALYKMYNTFSAQGHAAIGGSSAEKKTRKDDPTGSADLQALLDGVLAANNTNFLLDNVNLAEAANMLAATIITSNVDLAHKNYYLYRDTNGTGEWYILPWDVDLSFGHNWTSDVNYFNDNIYTNNGLFVGNNNGLIADLFAIPAFSQMYLRRLRTLMDEQLQAPGTPAEQLKFERRMDELLALTEPDANLDRAKWGNPPFLFSPGVQGLQESMAQAVQRVKTQFFPARRTFLYGQAQIPGAQPDIAALPANQRNIAFGVVEVSPASHNQDEEYIEVLNNNAFAVDISNWKITGGIDMTFQSGTVIPANSKIYVVPDAKVFRARTAGPRGNQGLLIQGGYDGHLSALGETLNLVDASGDAITSLTTPNTATDAQKYLRITEIMYNPAAAGGFDAQELEYVELTNTGPSTISLNGLKFVSGIDYVFPNVNLAAGSRVILAKNPTAFSAVNPGVPVLATGYTNLLNNDTEDLRLEDSVGEPIMDFDYHDSWYPVTDGGGYSLVIRSTSIDPGDYDEPESWRASEFAGGNPGADDNGVNPGTIVINEVLAHTDQPLGDWIELRNTSAAPVNIGGWYLSDSSANLRKFRIPTGTTIPANGYITFNQSQHFGNVGNPDTLASFAFSELGEVAYLSSGNGTLVGGYRDERDFGATEVEVTVGRHIKSTGGTDFVNMATQTMNAANSAPKVGPVVINEVMYHPAGDNEDDEFIEIRNITGAAVPLFDPAHPANTWRLTQGSGAEAVNFQFPANVTLPAGGLAIIVPIDPALYRAQHGLSPSVLIYGPYGGHLSNDGEVIRLSKPGDPEPDNSVPYISVDHVKYEDVAPWPILADGDGSSIIRAIAGNYANDPANWLNGNVGGTPGAANVVVDLTPPTTPTSLAGAHVSPTQVHLTWSGSTDNESGVASYNVYRNGNLIGSSATTSYDDSTVQPGVMYTYSVSAVNGSGTESVRSSPEVHADAPPNAVADSYTVAEDGSLVTTVAGSATTTYLTTGSIWKYLVTGTDPGSTWKDEMAVEPAWPQGPSELGFNTDNTEPLEATVIGYGGNTAAKYSTTYFRTTFNISDISGLQSMLMKLKRDDGAAVWINGIERIRDGVPGNPGDAPTAYSYYSAAVGDDGASFVDKPLDLSWFKTGKNTIAVEIHQGGAGSSDLSFDMIIEGTPLRRTGVLANDVELENQTMTSTVVTQPTHGTLTPAANGTFTYTPFAGFNGVDSFTYSASDGVRSSLPATVTINVIGENDAPTANAAGPYTATAGVPKTLSGAASSDPETDDAQLTFQWDLDYDGVTFQADATGISPTVTFATAGNKTIAVRVTDPQGLSAIATTTVTVGVGGTSSIAGRHVFYNQSKFDGDNAAAGSADDASIATDKTALLPGQTSAFANYTSYNRGLNGIMVDIANLPAGAVLSASDFGFKVGNSSTTSAWAALATAPTVTVRPGAGVGGSSRVTLIWPSGAGAIRQWLQVTVKANANTGLANPDVFYFGNAVGESGNVVGDYSVSITDELLARNNPVSVIPGTTVINRFDYNRDGTVSVIDQLLSRNNLTTVGTKLQQVTVPSALFGSGLVAQGFVAGNDGDSSGDIARGLAASSLGSSTEALTIVAGSASSPAMRQRLQPQALSAFPAQWDPKLGIHVT